MSPSGRDILASAGRGLRSARYAISDLVFVAGRGIARCGRSLARAASRFWAGLSAESRRRLPLAAGAAAGSLLLLAVAVPNLPCQFPRGDSCPPADNAAELVPADALAYAHANLDPETEQTRLAGASASSLPLIAGQIVARALAIVPGPDGRPPSYESEIEPWFGGEAAVAVVGRGATAATQVDLLEVVDAAGAEEYAASVTAGRVSVEDYRGVELATDQRGVSTARVQDFLAIGPAMAIREVIDVATGAEGTGALADDQSVADVRDELPEHRLADAYVSEEGAGVIVAERRPLGALAPLIEPGASVGAAAALTATESGFELAVRSALDPERTSSAPGFFAAFPPFEPGLPDLLPGRTLAYLGFGEPGATVRALLAQASAQAPGIVAGFENLLARLRREGGVDLERDLLDALGGEAAFALAARSPEQGEALPYLVFVAADTDEARARRALASLQGPLAAAVDPGSDLQAPVFGEAEVEGVETRSLRISPAVELTSAVFDGLAVIATDPAAVASLAGDGDRLADSELFRRATDELGAGGSDSLITYLDLGELIAVGERLGLAEDPAYATFAGELRRLEALGMVVASSSELLRADARLLVAGSDDAEAPPQQIAPSD